MRNWHFDEIWLNKTQPYQRSISEIFHLRNAPVVLYELLRNVDSILNGYRENSAQTRHESTMFEICNHVWPAITLANKDIGFLFSVSKINLIQYTKVPSFVAVRWSLPILQVVNFAKFFEETEFLNLIFSKLCVAIFLKFSGNVAGTTLYHSKITRKLWTQEKVTEFF